MSAATSYNYLEEYIDALRSKGIHFFTYPGLKKIFGSSDPVLNSGQALKSDQALKKALQRLKSKKKIELVRKGFYVILSPEYRDQGIFPPSSFVPDLMNFLGRDYYIG